VKAIQRALVAAVVVVLVGAWVPPAQASLLSLSAYDGDAYQDPGAPNQIAWYGSSTYSQLSLTGSVDWVVFGPGQFANAFPGSSYNPPANELVYAFQIDNTDTSDTSTLTAAFDSDSPADTIGSFPLGDLNGNLGVSPGTSPGDVALTPGSAYWFFPGGITMGESSIGLAYASPNTPEQEYGSLINSGLGAYAVPLPGPSTSAFVVVPEPSTVILLAAAATLLGLRRRFWCSPGMNR
jgi:hypothetical protein